MLNATENSSMAVAEMTLDSWIERVERRTLRVGIVGLGYVGLPLTLLFAEQGFRITGLDIDPEKVAKLNRGESYIHRIEPEHLRAAQRAGFTATNDFASVAALDVVLICVPTPLAGKRETGDHTPDMSFVVATIEALAPHLRAGQLVKARRIRERRKRSSLRRSSGMDARCSAGLGRWTG